MKNRFIAFTLAEVLITLGIIGIVAAMTIPSLLVKYQKQEVASKLEKMYSLLSQAIKNSELENGGMNTWSRPSAEWNSAASKAWYDTYFIPYTKISVNKLCSSSHSNCWSSSSTYLDGSSTGFTIIYSMLLSDGTSVMFCQVNNNSAIVYVDVNGFKKPNVVGKDIFYFDIAYPQGKFLPGGMGYSRTDQLSTTSNACNKSSGAAKGNWCSGLIMRDGWKIADDYPW